MLKSSEKKMIVTTIQKMANAVRNPKYASVMVLIKIKRLYLLSMECHSSQFGKMHAQIQKHFEKANYIGLLEPQFLKKTKVQMDVLQQMYFMQAKSWTLVYIST